MSDTYPANYAQWAMSPCCRRMETRKCPTLEGCGDKPCARFESNDEVIWEGLFSSMEETRGE